jgi:hypothetical protein
MQTELVVSLATISTYYRMNMRCLSFRVLLMLLVHQEYFLPQAAQLCKVFFKFHDVPPLVELPF